MSQEFRRVVWTFTGLRGVDLGGLDRIELGSDFFLSRPSPLLLSVRHRQDLSGREWNEMEEMECFLVFSEPEELGRVNERELREEALQNGLISVTDLEAGTVLRFHLSGE